MTIKELLAEARSIWGPRQMINLSDFVIIPMGVIFGDICRWEREQTFTSGRTGPPSKELQKELGNLIFSTIRWCDDLGLDPEKCLERAIECQKKWVEKRSRYG